MTLLRDFTGRCGVWRDVGAVLGWKSGIFFVILVFSSISRTGGGRRNLKVYILISRAPWISDRRRGWGPLTSRSAGTGSTASWLLKSSMAQVELLLPWVIVKFDLCLSLINSALIYL